jgi:hypothetical protein
MWVNMMDKPPFRVGTVALILMKFSFSVYLLIHRFYFWVCWVWIAANECRPSLNGVARRVGASHKRMSAMWFQWKAAQYAPISTPTGAA